MGSDAETKKKRCCPGCRIVFFQIVPILLVLVAVFCGYVLSSEVPAGTFFWFVFQPSRFMDMYKGKMTPEVPSDLQPMPRPANEIFFELPSQAQMPGSGIGMCCRGTAYDQDSVRKTTLWYLLQGGRLIDTAALYLNHEAIGLGIKDAIARGIPRSEIFVTSKLWPNMFGGAVTTYWIDKVLADLDLEYVDLLLMHAPFPMSALWAGEESSYSGYPECNTTIDCWNLTWKALAEAQKQGKVRDLGVSNFNIDHLKAMQELEVVQQHPVGVNQIPFNPWVPDWEKEVVKYCHDNKIAVTGYTTLGGSFDKDRATTAKALREISVAHGVTPFLVLSRWSLQKGVAIIPGTGNPEHMASNLKVFSFDLSEAEMSQIDAFERTDKEAPMFMAFSPPKDAK